MPERVALETRWVGSRFENRCDGQTWDMTSEARDGGVDSQARLPALVFVFRRCCGVCRRMEGLVAWVRVTEKKRLRVIDLDADRDADLAARLGVTQTPAFVLVKDRRVVGRLDGRVTGRQIDDLIRPHLAA